MARGSLIGGLLIALGLPACDCLRRVSAVVLDADTNAPIEGVEIRERHEDGSYDDHPIATGADGAFEFSDVSGGFRKCPDVQLHVAKPGYVPIDRSFPSSAEGDTIRLQRTR